ncbi:MAG: hypothetical protein JWO10_1956, partial [Microbacteriaceae bacterium]|nr:hypothetical protein [Microbacteriaceae bacterium]
AALELTAQTSAWGARTIAVTVASAAGAVGQSRSSIVWYPADTSPTTDVAVAVPLTVPQGSTGLIPVADLVSYTAPNGVLTRQLDQLEGRNVAIGIDPMILASIRILGTSAPITATEWLARLATFTNPTFALGYADYDLSAGSQAGMEGMLAPTSFAIDPGLFPQSPAATPTSTGTPTPTPTPGVPVLPTVQTLTAWNYTMQGIAWPADDTVIEKDLDQFSAAKLTTTILGSGNVSYGTLGYTPSAAATVSKHGAIVSDKILSTLLRKAAASTDELEWSSAMSGLAAALATVARERPADTRTVLATLGRQFPEGNFRLGQTLDALEALPWAGAAGLADVVNTVATTGVTATLAPQPESAAHITSVVGMLASETLATNFSSVLTDPTVLTGERRLALLGLLANSWSAYPEPWNTATTKYVERTSSIVGSVSIASTSSFVLTSSRSNLPITVANKLPWPVTVYVTLRSPTGVLNVVDSRVALTLEADSQAKALVPVESLANGDVRVRASLSSSTGVTVGSSSAFDVDVQAGWETLATALVAVGVVGVFGFGIWRTVAKRRKASKARAAGKAGVVDAGEVVADDSAAATDGDPPTEVPAS